MTVIELPAPRTTGGKPLMETLMQRVSTREFSDCRFTEQTLADLLWAAAGINRPDTGRRTAPSTRNWQETDIYVALEAGLYLFAPVQNALEPVLDEDVRGATGRQFFVKDAAVNLIYVADYSRMSDVTEEEKDFYSAVDTGIIAQNVYLFCASEDLRTVLRGNLDKRALSKKMNLRPEQRIILAQSVGFQHE